MKKNCWEIKNCGRLPGGNKVDELGECPAVKCFDAYGINDGINGGRHAGPLQGLIVKVNSRALLSVR